MFGLLNINKPPGVTSRKVVDHVQMLVRPAKAGHAGTLDPLATGVLIVCVGDATRLIEYVQRLQKQYRATFLLGRSSDTDDIDGHVVALESPPQPSVEDLKTALPRFVGDIRQRPPDYSAVKIHGRRAYDLARGGERVTLKDRPVRIDRIEVLSYCYPELQLDVHCGSGTYIRALGRDLAKSLGTASVLSQLTRMAIGPFRLKEAFCLDELDSSSLARMLLPAVRVFEGLPTETLSDDEVPRVLTGQSLHRPGHGRRDDIPAVARDGRLVAVLSPRGPDWLRPVRTFPPSNVR
jgi:tRNA pseudouridine55 synthase